MRRVLSMKHWLRGVGAAGGALFVSCVVACAETGASARIAQNAKPDCGASTQPVPVGRKDGVTLWECVPACDPGLERVMVLAKEGGLHWEANCYKTCAPGWQRTSYRGREEPDLFGVPNVKTEQLSCKLAETDCQPQTASARVAFEAKRSECESTRDAMAANASANSCRWNCRSKLIACGKQCSLAYGPMAGRSAECESLCSRERASCEASCP